MTFCSTTEQKSYLREINLHKLLYLPIAFVGFLFVSSGLAAESTAVPLAPGYGKLAYQPPDVASYDLPSLGIAPDAIVLDEKGTKRSLHGLYKGKYTLLSFIYSHCGDVNGCPLSSHVFYKIKRAMNSDPELANRLQLLSISFDPKRDTPDVMRQYGENFKFAGNKGQWGFLTTSSEAALAPILAGYNQDIQREKTMSGEETGDISHILRVFLIDPEFQLRNIYSVGFLHADLVLNDLKTLFIKDNEKQKLHSNTIKISLLSKPGDSKEGYEKSTYTTASKALIERKGKVTDLLAIAQNPPLGLPKIPFIKSNSLTTEKIALGRKLFFDRRLSLNGTISCAMCHIPEQGFTNNEVSMAVGFEGRSVRRNSPTIYNVAYASTLFHDGRENSLETQVWGPLLAQNEMANPSVGYVLAKLKGLSDYQTLFAQAFTKSGINMQTVGTALASYERSLVSANSPFDQWFYANKKSALIESAKRGYELFNGKANCSSCHNISKKHALFTDNQLHNTGVGYRESMGIKPDKQKITLAPGVFIEVDSKIADSIGEKTPSDLGLYEITQNPDDRWKYKTPTLRNIHLTAPYMHNGSLGTLKSVVRFYNQGGIKNELLDSKIKPLNLSEVEINELVSFLESLTGSNVDNLVADAFAAPIGD